MYAILQNVHSIHICMYAWIYTIIMYVWVNFEKSYTNFKAKYLIWMHNIYMYVCKYVCKISLVYKFNMAHVHYCFCCHVMIMFIYNEFFIFVATKQKKEYFIL